jgi:hypothetical protein
MAARRKFALLLSLLAFVVPTTVGLSGSAAAAAPAACATTWGSLPKEGGLPSLAPLVASRTGPHECYDSLVFEFDGDARGVRVEYASEVYSEGQGLPLSPYCGDFGALLGIYLLEPAHDQNGQSTYSFTAPDLGGYETFRGMAYGGSFEGYTTFALGVRAHPPFQVLLLPGPGSHSRIVVNVAHSWA